MNRRRVASGVALLALVAVAGPAGGGPIGGVGTPKQLLMELSGFKTSAPSGAETLGEVTLGLDHAVTTLVITGVQMRNGPLTEGPAALRPFDLYNPNLFLIGDRALLEQVSAAPAQTKLTLLGYLTGARRLMLVEVRTG